MSSDLPAPRPGPSRLTVVGTALGALIVLVAGLVALFVLGDDEPADLEGRLAGVVERTFAGTYAYAVTLEADADAVRDLGSGAAEATRFLDGLGIDGVRAADGYALQVRVLGIDLLEVRGTGGGASRYLRLAVDRIPGLGDLVAEESLRPALAQLGLDPAVQEALVAALRGRWVEVRGPLDLSGVADLLGDAGSATGGASAPSGLGGWVQRYVDVRETLADDGRRTYRIDLHLRDVLRTTGDLAALAGVAVPVGDLERNLRGLPATIPGSVFTDGDVVTAVRFDLAEAARRAGREVDGAIDLELRLSEHGRVRAPSAPADPVVVDAQALVAGLEQLARFGWGVGG